MVAEELQHLRDWLESETASNRHLNERLGQLSGSELVCEHVRTLLNEVDRLGAEIERLQCHYGGGDQHAQAVAWSAVYQECERLGILSYWGGEVIGRDRVIGFIRHLKERADAKEKP